MSLGLDTTYQPSSLSEAAEDTPDLGELIARLPRSLTVSQQADQIRIRESWFHWEQAVGFTLFSGLALFLASQIVSVNPVEISVDLPDEMPLWAIAGILGAIAWGIYWSLGWVINATRLTASAQGLTRRIGPLPWLGHFDLAADDVDQLYVVRTFKSVRRSSPWDSRGGTSNPSGTRLSGFSLKRSKQIAQYRLVARLTNGKVKNISNAYAYPFTPRLLEGLLEVTLGISDQVTADEYRGIS